MKRTKKLDIAKESAEWVSPMVSTLVPSPSEAMIKIGALLRLEVEYWNSSAFWSKENALLIVNDVDPRKVDPTSNEHVIFLRILNILGTEKKFIDHFGEQLPYKETPHFWLKMAIQTGLLSEEAASARFGRNLTCPGEDSQPAEQTSANLKQRKSMKASDKLIRAAHKKVVKERLSLTKAAAWIEEQIGDSYSRQAMKDRFHSLGLSYSKR